MSDRAVSVTAPDVQAAKERARKRKLAGWSTEATRMGKSGYAPRKAELAEWVIELSRESDRLAARVDTLERLAKNARAVAAAPDYDEEAIKDALWAVVDAALSAADNQEQR